MKFSVVLALLLAAACCVYADVSPDCSPVSLDSRNFRFNSRVLRANIISATVIHRRSRSRCVLNSSYGFQNRLLWVNNGCRATFRVCFGNKSTVTCSSWDFQPATCDAGAPIISLSVKRRNSRSRCVPGVSYRAIGNNIRVTNGCRAVFNVVTRV